MRLTIQDGKQDDILLVRVDLVNPPDLVQNRLHGSRLWNCFNLASHGL